MTIGIVKNLSRRMSTAVKALASYLLDCLAISQFTDCNVWVNGDPSKPACISCVTVGGGSTSPSERVCKLEVTDSSITVQPLADPFGPSPNGVRDFMECPRGMEVFPSLDNAPNHDIHLRGGNFFAGPGNVSATCPPISPVTQFSEVRYHLQKDLKIEVDPCHPYACRNQFGGPWLCRAFINHERMKGWRMWCNPLISGDQGAGRPTDQELVAPRPILLELDTVQRQPMLVHFTMDGNGDPAFQYEDQWCFTKGCYTGTVFRTFDCIGAFHGSNPQAMAQLTNIDRLFVNLNCSYSVDNTAFPHANPADVQIKNLVLLTLAKYVDQLDHQSPIQPAHIQDANYDDKSLNRWRHIDDFQSAPPGDPNRRPYPPVTVDGTVGGQPIRITCKDPVTGQTFLASLRLSIVEIILHVSVERKPSWPRQVSDENGDRRAIGCVDLDLVLVLELDNSAYNVDWPFEFIGRSVAQGGTGNSRDLRVELPGSPGVEHPDIKLVPRGPSGERVPLKISWRGLRHTAPYAREPIFEPGFPKTNQWNTDCCPTLDAMNGALFFGELNDFNETESTGVLPQRYEGDIQIIVPHIRGQGIGVCLP